MRVNATIKKIKITIMGIRIGIGGKRIGQGNFDWNAYWAIHCPELLDYIDGLTTSLTFEQKKNLREFIIEIKDGLGILLLSDAFDCIWLLAGETKESSYKNLVKNDHHCTDGVAPTWTQYEGVQGNGTTQYIRTDYIPSTDAVNALQNDISIGVYSRVASPTISKCKIGVFDYVGDSPGSFIFTPDALLKTKFTCNTFGGGGGLQYQYTNKGLTSIGRIINTACNINAHGGNLVTSSGLNSTNLPTKEYYICAEHENISATNFCDDELSLAFISKYLTINQREVIEDAIVNYLTAVGKEVIYDINGLTDNILRNGTFDDTSVWTFVYGNWSIAGGVALFDGIDSGVIRQSTFGWRISKQYQFTFTTLNAVGLISLGFIGNAGFPWQEYSVPPVHKPFTVGTNTIILTCIWNGDAWFEIEASNLCNAFDLDNVSLKRYK